MKKINMKYFLVLSLLLSIFFILGCENCDVRDVKMIVKVLKKERIEVEISGNMLFYKEKFKIEEIGKNTILDKEFMSELKRELNLEKAFSLKNKVQIISENKMKITLSYGFYTFYDLMDNIVKNLFDLGNVKINFLENKKEVIMDIEGNINNVNPFEKIELISKIPLENNADKKEDNKFVWILKGKSHKKIFIKIKKDSLSNNKK